MKIRINPSRLIGAVTPPPSKSIAHRAIIAAALSPGKSIVHNFALSEDIQATLGAIQTLGASYEIDGRDAVIDGIKKRVPHPQIDCHESGSTLRFLIPLALVLSGGGDFYGRGRLLSRPLDEYGKLFTAKGISWSLSPEKLTVKGKMPAGEYRLRGDVSTQFISGLLFALPLLEGDSYIALTTPIQGPGYIEMTLAVLKKAGIMINNGYYAYFKIKGGQSYGDFDLAVEADYSQAAFFLAANAIGNSVDIIGLNPVSPQGDRQMFQICRQLGGEEDLDIDVSHIPDLVPAITVAAALREGRVTRLTNASRLRIKESDRLAAIATELNKLGASIEEAPDALTISGVSGLTGGATESHNDHRIAMALAIAASRASGDVIIEGAESVAKSYPGFWEHYLSLGGVFDEI